MSSLKICFIDFNTGDWGRSLITTIKVEHYVQYALDHCPKHIAHNVLVESEMILQIKLLW